MFELNDCLDSEEHKELEAQLSISRRKFDEIIRGAYAEIENAKSKWREEILRVLVTPPIKGEITKGKLRYRGISFAEDTTNLFKGVRKCYILQRGKKIGSAFCIKYPNEANGYCLAGFTE